MTLADKIEKAWRWEHIGSGGVFHGSLSSDEQALIVAALRASPPETGEELAAKFDDAFLKYRPEIFGEDDSVAGPPVTRSECIKIAAALRSSPPPTAGREEIARIINPTLYAAWDLKRTTDAKADKWFEATHKRELAAVRAKADAILRLTPTRSAEPVAWRWKSLGFNHWQYAESDAEFSDGSGTLQPLYASPPVSDASREAIKSAIRTFCLSLGAGSVQMAGGVERIYYAGISLDALSVAVVMALAKPFGNTGGANG